MKPKMIVKLCIDIGMTIVLLLLMPYELVGQVALIGAMVSGTILSRHALSFLPISGGRSFARRLHIFFRNHLWHADGRDVCWLL